MYVNMFKGKIHRATVTEADLNYVGSITIDGVLLEAAGILPGEKVQVANIHNGARFDTYTLEGPRNSGMICINGAAARLAQPGDKIIIITYCWLAAGEARTFKPTVVIVDEHNRPVLTSEGRQPDLKLV